jgi:hypothetical protein
VSVIYSPNKDENLVKKPIKLDCEMGFRIVKNNENSPPTAWYITVLQDELNVINADNYLFGRVEELTNTYIKFTGNGKDSKLSYSINRMDGSLTGTFFDTKRNETLANYYGSCKKRVNETRKF